MVVWSSLKHLNKWFGFFQVTDLPVHFHTHSTSSASLATTIMMARAGCDIIDFATASLADGMYLFAPTPDSSMLIFLAVQAPHSRR